MLKVLFWLLSCTLKVLFVIPVVVAVVLGDDVHEGLPFCGVTNTNKYLFVSTLDGKVTALNPENEGSLLWSIHPGAEAMLSSSIHKLELTNHGQLVRMIPSLTGGLYKFNGENIEPIPVTAEHLLQSSFRYSDDLVISGGKESQTFGVSLATGKVLYECSMKGCGNQSSDANDVGDMLVIQRLGQVVRAVEPRTGSERWNFSVAQHDLKLISDCHHQHSPPLDYQIKVIVPEGLVCAVSTKDSSKILWKYKFGSPIVSAWEIHRGTLVDIDLFSGPQHGNMDVVPYSPSLYIGMHEKQVYIQESVLILQKRHDLAMKYGQHLISHNAFPSIPWRPVAVTGRAVGLIEGSNDSETAVDEAKTTALSVLYGSAYVEGSGFYLYSEEDWKKTHKGHCNVTIHSDQDEDHDHDDEDAEVETPVQIVIVSLWYWWREVFVISATTALLFNIVFTRRFFVPLIPWVKVPGRQVQKSTSADSGIDMTLVKRTDSESQPTPEFLSRYLADFDQVDRLGKGGFGLVFKAKNKIDDCEYAVKRIALPNHEESREKVMREVRALAKLDHHHIVRYFNAWMECPPPGWQEEQDRSWIHSSSLTNNFSTGVTQTCPPSSVNIPMDPSPRQETVFLNLHSTSSLNTNSTSLCGSEKRIECKTEDASDSFIVFASNGSQDSCASMTKSAGSHDGSCKGSDSNRDHRADGSLSRPQRPASLNLNLSEPSPLSSSSSKVYLYIQMQLCQPQSLRDWLMIHCERDYGGVMRMFDQIVEAVEYVHLRGLIHRDLKPSNIFFSLDGQIKVGDFGLATTMWEGGRSTPSDVGVVDKPEKHTAQVGTHLYMSPEQLRGQPYDYKVDIYSLGLILFELLVPFTTQMERLKVLQNIKDHVFTDLFQSNYRTEYELLKLMLSKSPVERPTTYGIRARQPLRHNTFQESSNTDESWHFDLPSRRRGSSKTSLGSSSSGDIR